MHMTQIIQNHQASVMGIQLAGYIQLYSYIATAGQSYEQHFNSIQVRADFALSVAPKVYTCCKINDFQQLASQLKIIMIQLYIVTLLVLAIYSYILCKCLVLVPQMMMLQIHAILQLYSYTFSYLLTIYGCNLQIAISYIASQLQPVS